MDNSIVTVASETIREDLQTSGAALQMILSGYLLVFGVLVVTGARLGSDFGHRRIFSIGLAGFTASSLLCGLALNPGMLIATRLLQGGFGALMVPQVLSLIQIGFTGAARARAIGVYSMILALGVGAGQVLGGAIVSANMLGVTWRAAFLINVPVGIALLMIARLLPRNTGGRAIKFDLSGITLLAVSMAAVIVPLIFGREGGWPVWMLVVIAAGLAGLALFFLFERGLSARGGQPVFEVDALRPPGVKAGLLACCVTNFAFAGVLFPFTMHAQFGLGFSPLEAGLMFLPYPIGFGCVSLTWTRLPKHLHPRIPIVGLSVFAASLAVLAYVVQGAWQPAAIIPLMFLAGAGMAAGFSTLMALTAAIVGPKYAAEISGMISTGTLLASVVSVAVVGSVYFGVAGGQADRSAGALSAAFAVDAALLLLGVALAVRVWLVLSRAGETEPAPESLADR